ncbi:MAG TPA: coproporphyrinogen-III oxidase family protein, partial [Polyangiaceae bacterium]|nr:coproporphyrinogen-III oxidase family protein [Polyangiaceae bacterium]
PSLWEPRQLGRVLAALLETFPHEAQKLEITAECNPSSFDASVAQGFRAAGVNRISLGVQGLEQERLRFLGRLHDAGSALAALALATRHFENVSADLIFGVDRQLPDVAASEVEIVVQSGVKHVSAYALTVEPGTQFGELQRRGRLPLLADELVAESFERVESTLESHGFEHYEISNYARAGRRARHNLGYWLGEPYLGLGAGAFGTLPRGGSTVRYRNTPAIERYLAWADSDAPLVRELWSETSPWVASREDLSAETLLQERILLGLRLLEGLDVERAEAETGASFWTDVRKKGIDRWVNRGALRIDGSRLRLNKTHFLIADRVLVDLL